jgi:nicotinamidase-related amidase|tara:strand:+ start:3038 stop:3706 length:669 start_codon:yes stop_codon:yes gene_type:complete
MAQIFSAEPFKFTFDPLTTALMVIDMQRDFIDPNGFGAALGNDIKPLRAIIPPTARLIAAARGAGLPIIHTRECHAQDLSDCPTTKRERGKPTLRIGDLGPMGRILVTGEPGTEIVAELKPIDGEIVVDKPGKGAFYATNLQDQLERLGVESLIFAGVTTEVCVQTTMREANDRGYNCLLATDATESYFPEFKSATIEMIRAQGAIIGWTAKVFEIEEALND